MNKFIVIAILFVVVVFVTGCAMKKSADIENIQNETENDVDYIVTTEIPKAAAPGVKDTAEPGYVPIYPFYDTADIPAKKGKIKWFKTGLGSRIPAFPRGDIMEVINTDKQFVAYIANVEEKDFEEYYNTLFLEGYKGRIETWEGFTLFNPEIAINLRYSQERGSVSTVRARLIKDEDEYEKLCDELL